MFERISCSNGKDENLKTAIVEIDQILVKNHKLIALTIEFGLK